MLRGLLEQYEKQFGVVNVRPIGPGPQVRQGPDGLGRRGRYGFMKASAWVSSGTTLTASPKVFSAALPVVDLDRENDVLRITVSAAAAEPTECILDAEEIFVFLGSVSKRAVSFAIPHFQVYWSKNLDALADHVESYLEPSARNLRSALFSSHKTVSPSSFFRKVSAEI